MRQVTKNLIGIILLLLPLFISGELANLFGKIIAGELRANTVLLLLGLNSVTNLIFILPLAFFLALFVTFSKLHHDNEIVVIQACGISQLQLFRGQLSLIVVFAGFVALLSLYLTPRLEMYIETIKNDAQKTDLIENIVPGRFKELARGIGIIYAESSDDQGRLHTIFLQQEDAATKTIIRAELAYSWLDKADARQFIILENGHRYTDNDAQNQHSVTAFHQYALAVDTLQSARPVKLRDKSTPTSSLWRSAQPGHIAELQWRISVPLVCITLAILALPLSVPRPRQGYYAKLAIAIPIYLIYMNLLSVSRVWLSKSDISIYIGLWWVHVVFLMLALVLWRRDLRTLISNHRQTIT